MTLFSLSAAQVAGYATTQLGRANASLGLSVARLSSGERLVRAADDVAALSVSTGLRTSVTTLRQSLNNALQATSYLGVADAALGNVTDILQRMEAVAVQASSGALSGAERGFLNQEFRNLFDEIDRIAENTSFNGLNVLQQTHGLTQIGSDLDDTAAEQAHGSLIFSGNISAGQTLILNGITLTEGVDFARSTITTATIKNLADALNASTNRRLNVATYEVSGQQLNIAMKAGGALGNLYTINERNSTAKANFTTYGTDLDGNERFTLLGGENGALNLGGVTAGGGALGGLLTGQQQVLSSAVYYFQTAGVNLVDGDYFRIDDGISTSILFTFRDSPNPADPLEVQLGTDSEDTVRNLVTAMNNYLNVSPAPSNDTIHGIRHVRLYRNGDQMHVETYLPGIPADIRDSANPANALDIGESGVGATITYPANATVGKLDSGSDVGGVNTTGILNEDFVGTISGFTADYVADNHITLAVTVGAHSYEATLAQTDFSSDTEIQFSSEEGGYFYVEFAAGRGRDVTSQTEADQFAGALEHAFSGLTFYQTHRLDLLGGSGLGDAEVSLTSDDLSNPVFEAITVAAAQDGESAAISFVLNGETYASRQSIGQSIGAHEIFIFESVNDANRKVTFTAGSTAFDLSTETGAAALQEALQSALAPTELDIDDTIIARAFQVGNSSRESIAIALNYIATETLFEDIAVNVTSQEAASAAAQAVLEAIDRVTAARAEVGALGERFDVAAATITSSLHSQEAARAALEDTDIAVETTTLAMEGVKVNASIGLMAQVHALQAGLIERLFA